jgi:hypothetical protein
MVEAYAKGYVARNPGHEVIVGYKLENKEN